MAIERFQAFAVYKNHRHITRWYNYPFLSQLFMLSKDMSFLHTSKTPHIYSSVKQLCSQRVMLNRRWGACYLLNTFPRVAYLSFIRCQCFAGNSPLAGSSPLGPWQYSLSWFFSPRFAASWFLTQNIVEEFTGHKFVHSKATASTMALQVYFRLKRTMALLFGKITWQGQSPES